MSYSNYAIRANAVSRKDYRFPEIGMFSRPMSFSINYSAKIDCYRPDQLYEAVKAEYKPPKKEMKNYGIQSLMLDISLKTIN